MEIGGADGSGDGGGTAERGSTITIDEVMVAKTISVVSISTVDAHLAMVA